MVDMGMYSTLTDSFGGTPSSSLGASLGLTFSVSLWQIYSFTRLATLMAVVTELVTLNMTNPTNCQVCRCLACTVSLHPDAQVFTRIKVLILSCLVSISFHFVLSCVPMGPILDKGLHSLSPNLPGLWIQYLYPFFSIDHTSRVCSSLLLSIFCHIPEATLMGMSHQNRYLELE
jgi:hypothetical protein